MKFPQLIAALALATTGAAFAADNHVHGHEHKPLHGGLVVEVKDMDYELVAKPAKLTLLSGTDKQEVELKPAGDKLEAKGSFKVVAGTKVVVVVLATGKSSTARFVLK